MLFHLEIRNAVAEQPADLGVLLEQIDIVSGAGQLLGAGHTGRAGAHHGDLLTGL